MKLIVKKIITRLRFTLGLKITRYDVYITALGNIIIINQRRNYLVGEVPNKDWVYMGNLKK